MPRFGVTIVARNDDYGGFLTERAGYCLNSMAETFDEILFVDWNTPDDKVSLIEEAADFIRKSEKIKWVRVTSAQAAEWTGHDPEAQAVCEVLARNIGLRRLTTDYLVSANIDIIAPDRQILENNVPNLNEFITTSKRSISLFDLRPLGGPLDTEDIKNALVQMEPHYGQQPKISIRHDDKFSLVSSPGDFQIAHKNVWYSIRGFEERFYKRGYTDTNIQQKAANAGFHIAVNWSIPVWHIGHGDGWGGKGGINDMNLALTMESTANSETWGFSEVDLEVRTW